MGGYAWEAGRLDRSLERAPDGGGIEPMAVAAVEDQAEVFPRAAAREAPRGLSRAVGTERGDGSRAQVDRSPAGRCLGEGADLPAAFAGAGERAADGDHASGAIEVSPSKAEHFSHPHA